MEKNKSSIRSDDFLTNSDKIEFHEKFFSVKKLFSDLLLH